MNRAYKSLFLLPLSTKKKLGEYGWEFTSTKRIPKEVLPYLEDELLLKEREYRLGMKIFVGDGIQLTAIYDDNFDIENIAMQLRTVSVERIKTILHRRHFNVDIFVPSSV